jgi:hypothetical protein
MKLWQRRMKKDENANERIKESQQYYFPINLILIAADVHF